MLKTGDLANPNKWRSIELVDIVDIATNLISWIIATRLTKQIATFGMDKQYGSLLGKGCTDATFTLKSSLQKLQEHQKEVHVLFVDLVKAYDSINQEFFWKILQLFGIPDMLKS